jgi:hypothetical protein
MEESEGRKSEGQEIVVFILRRESVCSECGVELWKGRFLRMEKQKPLCLECADLDHLVFLPRGDTALTRRSRKYSGLSAVVVQFSRTRGRYERQGLLVEEAALERAEKECLGDEEQRRMARERAAELREHADERYLEQFAEQIKTQYPGCPPDEAERIAIHACRKYSGRIGRSSAAKKFYAEAIEPAVKAHVRHTHTRYDYLLKQGWERSDARHAIAEQTMEVLERWRSNAVSA